MTIEKLMILCSTK